MDFGQAIRELKAGKRVARFGWNGKGMYIELVLFPEEKKHQGLHKEFLLLPCIGMKTADDKFLPGWLASQTDILAEDWIVVPG